MTGLADPIRTLVLSLEYPSRASYYHDWRDAFRASRQLAVTLVNIFHARCQRRLERLVREHDLIVVLHDCTADSLLYIDPLVPVLNRRRGRLLSFVGNELNLPWAPIQGKINWLKAVGADYIATQLLPEAGEWLYRDVGARVLGVPHALNPQAFSPGPLQADRGIDIGARSFRYLPYLGDNDRNRIFDFFSSHPFDPPLSIDMSTEHRFDRDGWSRFLKSCKATIATEAGSWYLQRDDATVLAIRDFLRTKNGGGGIVIAADSPLRRLAHRLPYRVKAAIRPLLRRGAVRHELFLAEDADYDDVHGRFFVGCPPCPAYSKCISSRHFDAIGSKTLQIMFPGRYNDILEAGTHYLALAPDFSNLDDVMRAFHDPGVRQGMVDDAWEMVMDRHTYAHRLRDMIGQLSL